MEHERCLGGSLHGDIKRVIATLDALLQNPATPEHRIQGTVGLLIQRQMKLHALDAQILAHVTDEALAAA